MIDETTKATGLETRSAPTNNQLCEICHSLDLTLLSFDVLRECRGKERVGEDIELGDFREIVRKRQISNA